MGRTAPLTSKCCILYIYSTNTGTEYIKHALYSPFFSLQDAVYFIMLTCLVSVLFTFYIQDVLKLKNNSGAKGLKGTNHIITCPSHEMYHVQVQVKQYNYRPAQALRFPGPRFQDSRHMKVVRLSAARNGRLYLPGNISGTQFC